MARVIATLRNLAGWLMGRMHDRHCPCGVQPDDEYEGDTVAQKVILPDARP